MSRRSLFNPSIDIVDRNHAHSVQQWVWETNPKFAIVHPEFDDAFMLLHEINPVDKKASRCMIDFIYVPVKLRGGFLKQRAVRITFQTTRWSRRLSEAPSSSGSLGSGIVWSVCAGNPANADSLARGPPALPDDFLRQTGVVVCTPPALGVRHLRMTGTFVSLTQDKAAPRHRSVAMAVYKSCGVLGFFKKEATEEDFKDSGYEPGQFMSSCGFLGLSPKAATLYSIPASWRQDCTPLSGGATGDYAVTQPGECTLQSCAGGAIKTDDNECVDPGTSCVPDDPQPHASYTYAATGDCALSACAVGSVKRPAYGVSSLGSDACPIGYTALTDAAACKAAASHYNIPFTGTIDEPGILPGCVVHGTDVKPGKVSFNTNASGFDSGGEQFAVCGRGTKDPCAVVGTQCGSASNYTWNSKGFCQGTCKTTGDSCVAGEKCCNGVCTPKNDDCVLAKRMKADAKAIGSQIHSLVGTFKELSASTAGLKGTAFKM